MKKEIIYDYNARKELNQFNEEVRESFVSYINILEQEGRLDFPEARKITKDILKFV